METITFAAAKGGVGKTTLTAALAVAAILNNPALSVGVVDLDPQGSFTRWWNDRASPQPALFGTAGRPLPAVQEELRAAGLDYVFFDCPPGFSTVQREAIAAADLVLIPTGASMLDLSAVTATADMAEEEGVPHNYILNRAVFRSCIAGEAVTTLRTGGKLMWPPVHQRVQIAAAMSVGRTAQETTPGSAAASELSRLWQAVQKVLPSAAPRMAPQHGVGLGVQS